jgi:signal transduction histidine kinase
MTAGSQEPLLHATSDSTSVFRFLREATGEQAFFAILQETLPQLLPMTRVDLLTSDQRGGDPTLFTCGDATDPLPAVGVRDASGLADWLGSKGYAIVFTLPLTSAGEHVGSLLLSRRRRPFEPETLTLAGQLATVIALRLMYDQSRSELEARDGYIALLERRLYEVEAVRLRATLAAGAAHDIGNLFAAVLGHAQLMQQNAPPALQPDLRTIVRAARDGSHLMRRMLALQAPQSGTSPTSVALLPTIIRDAIKLTQPFWETKPGIVVKTALAPVPAVRGHATELREVLINLIMNAIAAMPEGGTLTVRSYSVDDHVLVDVIDTGEGIARAQQSAIFQPFTTTRESGSGLGLSVSRTIIEGYGGTLTVDSAPGQGAIFRLSLPAIRSLDMLHEAQPPPHKCAVS